MKKIMKKTFNVLSDKKKVYLLAEDKEGIRYYLVEPSWNCDWYWGFGYVQTFPDNRFPNKSNDLTSHTHWDTSIVGNIDGKQVFHLNENPNFVKSVLDDNESWELADLMKQFYTLQKTAQLYHIGDSNLTSSENTSINKNEELWKDINENQIPRIFEKINKILSP